MHRNPAHRRTAATSTAYSPLVLVSCPVGVTHALCRRAQRMRKAALRPDTVYNCAVFPSQALLAGSGRFFPTPYCLRNTGCLCAGWPRCGKPDHGEVEKHPVVSRIQSEVEQTLNDYGYELVQVTFGGRGAGRVLSVYIDKPGGVTAADCEHMAEQLSLLWTPSTRSRAYHLMVSSPGRASAHS